ncbi:hypothetical protein M1141_03375 [Candidatus Marsarchaeota archaeon]|nr:hypothetical protein [Candidatus Marsarchaeota archaeon]
MEFLTTYSWAFLLIALMVGVLFVFAFTPKSIISSTCSFYSGFYCYDAVFNTVYSAGHVATGSELKVLLSDTQVGVINISRFNAVVSGTQSFTGSCTNTTLRQGNKTLCTASFNSIERTGTINLGVLNITGYYCAHAISNLNSGTCTSSSGNYIVLGNVRVQTQ